LGGGGVRARGARAPCWIEARRFHQQQFRQQQFDRGEFALEGGAPFAGDAEGDVRRRAELCARGREQSAGGAPEVGNGIDGGGCHGRECTAALARLD
jgi:hypothetical protein